MTAPDQHGPPLRERSSRTALDHDLVEAALGVNTYLIGEGIADGRVRARRRPAVWP